LLGILEAAVGHAASARLEGSVDEAGDAVTIEELVEISDRLFPEGTPSSVDYIRRMRDER
jgi:hypothetical protein